LAGPSPASQHPPIASEGLIPFRALRPFGFSLTHWRSPCR
jgi:hypothetical protein